MIDPRAVFPISVLLFLGSLVFVILVKLDAGNVAHLTSVRAAVPYAWALLAISGLTSLATGALLFVSGVLSVFPWIGK